MPTRFDGFCRPGRFSQLSQLTRFSLLYPLDPHVAFSLRTARTGTQPFLDQPIVPGPLVFRFRFPGCLLRLQLDVPLRGLDRFRRLRLFYRLCSLCPMRAFEDSRTLCGFWLFRSYLPLNRSRLNNLLIPLYFWLFRLSDLLKILALLRRKRS